jgi:hypothetical protein
MQFLLEAALTFAQQEKRKTIAYKDLVNAIKHTEQLEFLAGILFTFANEERRHSRSIGTHQGSGSCQEIVRHSRRRLSSVNVQVIRVAAYSSLNEVALNCILSLGTLSLLTDGPGQAPHLESPVSVLQGKTSR